MDDLRFIAEDSTILGARKRQSCFSGEMPGLRRVIFGPGQMEKMCLCDISIAVDGNTCRYLKALDVASDLFIPVIFFGSVGYSLMVLQLARDSFILCYFYLPAIKLLNQSVFYGQAWHWMLKWLKMIFLAVSCAGYVQCHMWIDLKAISMLKNMKNNYLECCCKEFNFSASYAVSSGNAPKTDVFIWVCLLAVLPAVAGETQICTGQLAW